MAPARLAGVILSLGISLLLLRSVAGAAAAPPSNPAAASECVAELVTFSPCLAFVSAPPNNLTDAASPECCAGYSAAVASGRGSCFCYLLREPRMLGFPLNATRVLSLPQACDIPDQSLDSLCSSGSEAMAPSQNETVSAISSPPDSAPSSQPSISLPPESGDFGTSQNSPADPPYTSPPEVAPKPLPTMPRSSVPTPSRSPGNRCLFKMVKLLLVILSLNYTFDYREICLVVF